jgi:hypothetical protein
VRTRLAPACLLAALALLALPATTAHADRWRGTTLGPLVKTATRIEVLEVAAIDGDAVVGKVADAVRTTRKVGDPVRISLGHPRIDRMTIAKGDRLLIVCDTVCPRVAGVEHDGRYTLLAAQQTQEAAVSPDLVERRSVELLAAGTPAPNLCFRGTFELLDELAPGTLEVSFDPGTGRGRGTVEGTPIDVVRMFLDELSVQSPQLPTGRGKLLFHREPPLVRAKDGCYTSTFSLSGPVPRTRAGVTLALAGTLTSSLLARGKLAIPGGGRTFELLINPDGQIEVGGQLARGTARGWGMAFPGSYGLFRRASDPALPDGELLVELDVEGSPLGSPFPLAVARYLRTERAPQARLRLRNREDYELDGPPDAVLGTVALTYVPERWAPPSAPVPAPAPATPRTPSSSARPSPGG